MEAVRLKVSRYIYCHRQSVSVIGDSLSRLDGKKIWKHYARMSRGRAAEECAVTEDPRVFGGIREGTTG